MLQNMTEVIPMHWPGQLLWEPKTLIHVINTADTERGIGELKLNLRDSF